MNPLMQAMTQMVLLAQKEEQTLRNWLRCCVERGP
jgi:hypothetical protein